jgi:TetR/AcrR family transcriptional regulator
LIDSTIVKTPPAELARQLVDVSDQILRADPALRLEDIAQMVGASRATMYYYFSGRDDLLSFLLVTHAKNGAQAVRDRVDAGLPPSDRLQLMIRTLVEFLGRCPGMCSGLLGALGGSGRLRDVLAANETWIAGPLREVLIEGRATGVFAVENVPDATNAMLGSMLLAVLGRSMSGEDTTDPTFHEQVTRHVTRAVAVP